jgi:sulfur-oxidizing protein SoxB
MTALKTGAPVDPARDYTVAGWASVNEGTEGPPIWDLVERYVAAEKVIRISANNSIKISGS